MTLKTVKTSLDSIVSSMNKTRTSREYIIKNSRSVIALCGQSIIKVHAGELAEAHALGTKAQSQLDEIKKKVTPSLSSHISVAEQEIVEMLGLIAVVEKKDIPTIKTMQVSGNAYVLGLLDCIGELKRRVLDMIRIGDSDEAVRVFEIMNELYEQIYPFASYDKVVKEVRRKLDVNRELIERARFAVAEASARARLEKIITESK